MKRADPVARSHSHAPCLCTQAEGKPPDGAPGRAWNPTAGGTHHCGALCVT